MEDNKGLMILDACYKKVLEGIPLVSEPVEELADSYLKKYSSNPPVLAQI